MKGSVGGRLGWLEQAQDLSLQLGVEHAPRLRQHNLAGRRDEKRGRQGTEPLVAQHLDEVVLVVFDPETITYDRTLTQFWEGHDPTQGMRQGNDVGTQYRSGVYVYSDKQRQSALRTKDLFQAELSKTGHGNITTEIIDAEKFYFAEDYHQQYLAKNPAGYCGLGGIGIDFPAGTA